MKSVFTSNQGVTEFFVALEGTRRNYFRAEMVALLRELDDELDGVKPIWIKFHVSDVVNQKKEIDRQKKKKNLNSLSFNLPTWEKIFRFLRFLLGCLIWR